MEQELFDESTTELLERSCIPYAIYKMTDGRVKALLISDGFCELFGRDRKASLDYLNNHIYDDDHPDDVARLGDAALAFARDEKDFNVIYRTRVGENYRILHARGKHIMTRDGKRVAVVWYADEGLYTDENEEVYDRAMNNMVAASAVSGEHNFDTLTGLPNMNHFFRLFDTSRDMIYEKGGKPVLLYFDFNDMKNYNLKYGFSEGDKLIVGMSRILVRHFSNVKCSRFGGDRFVALTDEENIEDVLKEIFEESGKINNGRSLPLRVGIYRDNYGKVSAGIACDRAKIACDEKRDNISSGFCYFSEDMLKEVQVKHYILDNFDTALKEGWIQVYYQPIIRSANGRVCDEEALSRWVDPNMGFLSPADFIPVLEDSKQIYKLDIYVLEQILKKIKKIAEHDLHIVPCSLNISRSDFEMCDIVEEIRKRVDESGIGREKLTIEITESAIASDMEYVSSQVRLLAEMGFNVWMDDYGSGYSSPEMLQNIPFSTIKLDMQFMRQFDKTKKSRIIISEIINMALNLGLETVVEGVETYEQVEFLREVGATKLQGFFYCRPIKLEEVLGRYEKGAQIGFENPAECEYYSAIGRVNLYDISLSTEEGEEGDVYFNTMPMAIFEADNIDTAPIRMNKAFKAVLTKSFGAKADKENKVLTIRDDEFGASFKNSVIRCGESGFQVIEDKKTADGKSIHTLFRRLAVNPVTGRKAVAIIMLEVRDENKDFNSLTYAGVARALSADYLSLYYVNVATDEFVEYSPNAGNEDIILERRGSNFFEESRKDAYTALHADDREGFINTFEKSIVLGSIEKYGAFTYTYRLIKDGNPMYVHMKATSIGKNGNHIIIGVNNIDAQMRQKEALERIKEEKLVFSRISALAGDYIAFYMVNPDDNSYRQFDESNDYKSLRTAKEGKDFFLKAGEDAKYAVYCDDLDLFNKAFTKENILRSINDNGVFTLNYRLLINGKPRFVRLKGAEIIENGKKQLLFGINDIDNQIKREQEYAYNLAVARNKVNLDALTGVKNKNAYNESENSINKAIEEYPDVSFAVVVFDINNLKDMNDRFGHSAGDELIRESCNIICRIFTHSPVFRIGGDEFVTIARGTDYDRIDYLMEKLEKSNAENLIKKGPVVAGGMSRYQGDKNVEEVFKRADAAMYENKRKLKGEI